MCHVSRGKNVYIFLEQICGAWFCRVSFINGAYPVKFHCLYLSMNHTFVPRKPAVKVVARSRLVIAALSSKKSMEEVDSSPPYQANKLKDARFREETKLKLPRQEFVDQLKDQLVTANFNKSLLAMMFHDDFKQHRKALKMLMAHVEADTEALIANLDLILKWLTFRFLENKQSVNSKSLQYLRTMLTVLLECHGGYMLHDLEAAAFIPYLVIKVGDPKEQIRLVIILQGDFYFLDPP